MSDLRVRTIRDGLPPGYLYRVEIRHKGDAVGLPVSAPKTLKLTGCRCLRRYVDFDGITQNLGSGLRICDFFKTKKGVMADYVEVVDIGWYAVEGDMLRKIEGNPPTLKGGRLQHFQDELLDAAIYVERLKNQLGGFKGQHEK